jgi:hypothetical protein
MFDHWQDDPAGTVLKRIPPSQNKDFVSTWCEVAEYRQGDDDSLRNMSELFRHLGLVPLMERWLRKGELEEKLLALQALSLLNPHEVQAWTWIAPELEKPDMFYSLVAANTLFRIDPVMAVPVILETYIGRLNWPRTKVSGILFQHNDDVITDEVLRFIDMDYNRNQRLSLPLIQLIRHHPSDKVSPFICELLYNDLSDEDTLLLLDVLWSTRSLPDVTVALKHVDHHDWRIRLKAVRLLGEHQPQNYRSILEEKCNDPEWWVAYRAQQALGIAERSVMEYPQDLQADRELMLMQ